MPLPRSFRAAYLPILIATSLCLMSADTSENRNEPKRSKSTSTTKTTPVTAMSTTEEARCLYMSGQFKQYGLSQKAFEYAWKGYQYLRKKGKVQRTDIISICDFSQSSRKKRLYVININEPRVLINTYVAHGRNSGGEYARSFSNSPESHKSSLGFYITRTTYYGDHGISLKIDGV